MSVRSVKEFLDRFGAGGRVLEFDVSSATVELAAQALGCENARIAKSIAFSVGGGAVLIVTAGDMKIDNQKFKACFGEKAKMLSPEQTALFTGYAVGGVCPFDVKDGTAVYLDESLKRFKTVFPAAGSSNSAIELTIEELERFSNYMRWVDVCKPREA